MKLIPLSRGEFTIVDDEDFEWLNQWKWSVLIKRGRKYAWRAIGNTRNGTYKAYFMHREIMNAPPGTEVDHRLGVGLDNRRQNLRLATHAQNMQNSKLKVTNRSGYKGVTWDKERGKWFASIRVNSRTKALGRFASLGAAVSAWNSAALVLRGEFATLNSL